VAENYNSRRRLSKVIYDILGFLFWKHILDNWMGRWKEVEHSHTAQWSESDYSLNISDQELLGKNIVKKRELLRIKDSGIYIKIL
jgi:hypothetical protein